MQNNIINITSTSNETIKYFISLNDKKTRMNAKRFIVEGYHLVNEASKTNLLEAIISTDEKELKKINNVKRYLVNDAIINKIATTKNPQNILGIVKMLDHNITNLLPIIKGNKTKLIMLEDVNDPGNLGTIIRTAAGLGYDGIIMSPNTVDLYNEKVIRSTQGVMFNIPIIKANLQEVIKMLKKEKVFCIGTALTNAKDVKHINQKDKFAIHSLFPSFSVIGIRNVRHIRCGGVFLRDGGRFNLSLSVVLFHQDPLDHDGNHDQGHTADIGDALRHDQQQGADTIDEP